MAHWHFFVDVAQAVVSKTDLFKCEFSDLKGFIFGGPYPPLPYQFLRRKGLSVDLLPIVSKYHLVIIMLRAARHQQRCASEKRQKNGRTKIKDTC